MLAAASLAGQPAQAYGPVANSLGCRLYFTDTGTGMPQDVVARSERALDDVLVWHELLSQPGWVEAAVRQLEQPS